MYAPNSRTWKEIHEANTDRTEGRNNSTIKVDMTSRQEIKEI